MSALYLLEHPTGSERYIGASKEGREDWTELGRPTRIPEYDEDWDPTAKKWKVNAERRAAREKASKARDPEKLLEMIEALAARIAALERGLP